MKPARWWNQPRFDVLEVGIVVLAAASAVAVAWRLGQQSMSPVADNAGYLPVPLFAEHHGIDIVRDFFHDRRGGFFVDIGAGDYRQFSTTYGLETDFDWSGIAVDPQRQFEEGYRLHRLRTRFFSFFVSDRSDQVERLFVGDDSLRASADRRHAEGWGTARSPAKVVNVPTITLTDLLSRLKVERVDFLSIDVELSEPKVLAGFDIDRVQPAFVCIEAVPQVRQPILDYFAAHRYVIVGKYLGADPLNLYFRPYENERH